MRKHFQLQCAVAVTMSLCCALTNATATPPKIKLRVLDSVTTEPIAEGAAEIAAHDPGTQRIFVVNAAAARVDVISIANPSQMEKIGEIEFASYGAFANSVAVHNGIVAVAIEDTVKQNPGKVVFYDANLKFLAVVTVGALPDMLTFSPDGKYVLVANEGEPNADYSVDPEGSVSIIDVSAGAANLTQANVRTADFKRFKKSELASSIRIFGPGASVAQDLEPEYITVSQDSKTAWVTCQENNAIAVVDIRSASVTKLLGLGFKDHSTAGAQTTIYPFEEARMPVIGTTLGGQSLRLGGFSGLAFEGINPVTGKYKFVSHTDRGPNAEPTGIFRPFLLPNFTPEIIRFELDRDTGALELTQRIPLQVAPGVPLTGLPNTALSADANAAYNDEKPVDLLGRSLPLDPLGADLEGVAIDPKDQTFWMADEYRPSLYHFSAAGVLIERIVPIGTAVAAGKPAGTFGEESLPSVLAQRRQNRGFEGITIDGGKIYAFVQSPIRNPITLSNAALSAMKNVRLVEFDPVTRKTRQFIYVMDNADLGAGTNTRADKIGDLVSYGNGEFLVIERDDDRIQADSPDLIEKKIYRFNLASATDISSKNGLIGITGKTVDQLTAAELDANGIKPILKVLHVDLNVAGYNRAEKVEGLTIVDPWTLAVVNDNDFGVAQITINSDGTFVRNYEPEKTQLGLIDLPPSGLDASDRDGKVNITHWPIKGVFMPDGIASYRVKGRDYLITANEGDAREYVPGLVEAVRLGDSKIVLNPAKFPNATALKNNANLGRLNIVSTLGKNPVTNQYDEIYSFGARSFSIWDDRGQLVYDSGDDFERITAAAFPGNFNASNSSNDFDNRSDDKGPEPEGVTLGKVFGRTYAFIGLERIGGVMVYDVTDPDSPEFVQYINNREFLPAPALPSGDLGPEGVLFISEENSPNGKPLLVTANEISGTTTVFEIEKDR